ncbi:response regulator [Vineibacter terrae]|uniref:Response regulator n=1 Tax=Vineibacter terrae TaxID=2586908 RepID=A0A5C8PNF5_9HYPH|nr:response regulator [Vineibacter terrae]TXL76302.1 response regulator [Vineibacter terrae]HEX2885492.1 response regulator [Vineibacter terrae]
MTSRPDVLVVDDDPSQCLEIAEYLHRRGFDVVEANDAASALHIMETRMPRVVISDISMPEVNGIRMTQTATAHGTPTKIILMSGDSEMVRAANVQHSGAFAVIHKPVPLKMLASFVERVVSSPVRAAGNG